MRSGYAVACACAVVVTGLYALVALRHVWRADGNYSVLLQVGRRQFDSNPLIHDRPAVRESLILVEGGYDGQFGYFAMFDPLATRYAHVPEAYLFMMDVAPYRFARIGQVWVSRVVAGRRWRSYPATLVWVVLVACGLSAFAMSVLATTSGASPWWGLAVVAVPGYWQSAQLALPEPFAGGLVLLGFLAWRRERWWAATLALSAALLTRETSLIVVVVVGVSTFVSGRRRVAVGLLLGSVLPYVCWRLHLGSVLAPVWGWEAYFFNPGTIGMPFAGIASVWSRIGRGDYYPGVPELAHAARALSVLIGGAATAAWVSVWRRPSAATVIAALYGLMAVCLSGATVWNHPGNAQRTSAELFLWLAVVVATWPSATRGPGWYVRMALLAASVATTVLFAHDAESVRAAFWWWQR